LENDDETIFNEDNDISSEPELIENFSGINKFKNYS
jgi:hypothetical protein